MTWISMSAIRPLLLNDAQERRGLKAARGVVSRTKKASLRWYDPDQVRRVGPTQSDLSAPPRTPASYVVVRLESTSALLPRQTAEMLPRERPTSVVADAIFAA